MFEALFLLFIKHFICDFPLQANPWLYQNKGTYLHAGGIVHAGIHGIGTLLVLAPFIGSASIMYALIDMVIHYHIDQIARQTLAFMPVKDSSNSKRVLF